LLDSVVVRVGFFAHARM